MKPQSMIIQNIEKEQNLLSEGDHMEFLGIYFMVRYNILC